MNTEKRLGIKKPKAILLFVQMILVILMFVTAIYLLVFTCIYNIGGWMVSSYIFITLSVLAMICYSTYGYKRGEASYQLTMLPFLAAIFINVMLPGRTSLQIGLLTLLFALTFAFLLRPKDTKFTYIVSFLMVAVSLFFSIYSAITADVSFLGNIGAHWYTYVAMYSSIFIPTIMSSTLALTYNVRITKQPHEE